MSIDNTNTPNGGSKNYNNINSNEGIVVNFASMSELNPEKEIVEQVDGKATATRVDDGDYKSIVMGDAIYSNLTIAAFGVGPIVKYSKGNPDVKKAMKEFKENVLKRKGIMSIDEYLKYVEEKAEKEDKVNDTRDNTLEDNR